MGRNGVKSSNFLVYGLVFLVTSPFPGTYRELLQASEQKIPITQKILTDLGALHQTFLSLRKLKKFGIMSNIIFDHNKIKLEINNKRKVEIYKYVEIRLLNNHLFNKEIKEYLRPTEIETQHNKLREARNRWSLHRNPNESTQVSWKRLISITFHETLCKDIW